MERDNQMAASRGYKIRSYINGKKSPQGPQYINYSITVPNEIAESVPDGMTFVPRLTDDGLLYEPVQQAHRELPAWAMQANGKQARPREKVA